MVAGLVVLSSVAATVPNIFLAGWLFGNSQAVVPLYFRALPLWAIIPTRGLFPVTIAFAELPTYFAYAMPRLEQKIGGLGRGTDLGFDACLPTRYVARYLRHPLYNLAVIHVCPLCLDGRAHHENGGRAYYRIWSSSTACWIYLQPGWCFRRRRSRSECPSPADRSAMLSVYDHLKN